MLEGIVNARTLGVGSKDNFERFVLNDRSLQVVGVEPFKMNQRLAIQQGLFLVPVSVERTFMD